MMTEHDLPRVRRLDVLIDPYDHPRSSKHEPVKWPMWATFWLAVGGSAAVMGLGFMLGQLSKWLWP